MKHLLLPKSIKKYLFLLAGLLLHGLLVFIPVTGHGMNQGNSLENILVSVQLKGQTIEDALNTLMGQTKLNFQYNLKTIKGKTLASDFPQRSNLAQVLKIISKETGLSFQKVNET